MVSLDFFFHQGDGRGIHRLIIGEIDSLICFEEITCPKHLSLPPYVKTRPEKGNIKHLRRVTSPANFYLYFLESGVMLKSGMS